MYFRGPISKRNGVSEKDFQRLKFGLRVFLLIVANLLLVIQVSLSLIFKTLFDTLSNISMSCTEKLPV